MLGLDYHDMSVCAAKVRMVLAENGLKWKDHYTIPARARHGRWNIQR